MFEALLEFFRDLASDSPTWNFIFLHDQSQWAKVVSGLWMTIKLSVACVFLSVVIGVVGAALQGAESAILRAVVAGYIQFFRNTPPFVQLLFFYFALGRFTPTYSTDGGWLEAPGRPGPHRCRVDGDQGHVRLTAG